MPAESTSSLGAGITGGLPEKLITAALEPFKFNLVSVAPSGQGMTIVYPTETFAKSAGYTSWSEAVEAMRAGNIIQGRGPRLGAKSMYDLRLFDQAIADAGMRVKYVDMGIVAIGLPDRFKD